MGAQSPAQAEKCTCGSLKEKLAEEGSVCLYKIYQFCSEMPDDSPRSELLPKQIVVQ